MRTAAATVLCLAAMSATAGPSPMPGSFDTILGGDGTVNPDIALSDYAYAGFLEPSGQIVIIGDSDDGNPSNREGIVLFLNEDGSQDEIARHDAAAFGCSVPRSFLGATRLRGGGFATAGYVQIGCGGIPRHLNVLQLDASGLRLDEFEQVPFNNQLAYAFGLTEQADGKIVAVGLISGSGFDGTTYDVGVARFLVDGNLDDSFGTGGIFTYDLDGDLDYARDVFVDRDGRIIVGAFGTSQGAGFDIIVLALNDAGALDPSFGNDGVFLYDRAGHGDTLGAIAPTRGERILLAGTTSPDDSTRELSVLALTADGALDPTFSGDGLATVGLGSNAGGASDVIVGPTGRIYVTGSVEIGGDGFDFREGVVASFTNIGTPAPEFNNGAPLTFTFGGEITDFPQSIDVDELESRILVTGFTQNTERTEQQFAATRLIGREQLLLRDSLEDSVK